MPKRLANCRGRTTARFGRVRIGWKKLKMLQQWGNLQKEFEAGDMDEKATSMFQDFKHRVRQIVSKKLLRRTQGK